MSVSSTETGLAWKRRDCLRREDAGITGIIWHARQAGASDSGFSRWDPTRRRSAASKGFPSGSLEDHSEERQRHLERIRMEKGPRVAAGKNAGLAFPPERHMWKTGDTLAELMQKS